MKKLLAFCCCISAFATAAIAQPNEYIVKVTPQEMADLGKALADKLKDAQALLALAQKLQLQLDVQNKVASPSAAAPPPEEPKP